jgi:hypothetical protein
VNCGVELGKSEKHCPLCSVEVLNPKAPWQEPKDRPYPGYLETLVNRIDRRYFATLAALILMIPIMITILLDILDGSGLNWSAYIVGAMALVFIFVVLPFYFKRYHTVIFLSANCTAVLLYLLFIERANGGSWFVGFGLPITVAASIAIIILALLFTKSRRMTLLKKVAGILFAVGLFVLVMETIIRLNEQVPFTLKWSFYALIPCAVLGAACLILEHRKNFKEEIRRRLFY